METVVLVNALVCIIASGIGIFIGLDLKKWYSWLLALYGFLSGFLFGFTGGSVSSGLQGGALFFFVIMCGGGMTYWQRQHYRKEAESWLSQHGQEKQYSFLARMIRRMLNKKL